MNNVQNYIMSKTTCNPVPYVPTESAPYHRRLAAAKLPAFQLTTNKKKKKNVNSPRINSFYLVYLIILL